MTEFDVESLAEFDGKEDKPVYIAHQGRVIDVSNSRLWRGGIHMQRHHAGLDLTTDILAAPHGTEVLDRYPQVGVLKKAAAARERAMPRILSRLLIRYPMLRRHPHPMTVHFPIVFLVSVTIFNLLYLMTGIKSFETTAFHCLGGAVLFTPIATGTGLLTWWLNYLATPLRPVRIKLRLVPIMWLLSLAAFVWRSAIPDVLESFTISSFFYLLLIHSFLPLVSAVGWFGAQMTFPIEKD
jgi:predicted heme/steroid binding protein/uncharacterized membrane protein